MTLPINLNRWLWLGIALLSLIASGVGVLHPSVYDGLIPATIRPGVFTQDLVAIVLSVVLVLLAGSNRSNLVRKRIVAHGILGFLFYAYGIYAMERMYNVLYPLYLMLFGGSLFVLIYSMATGPAMPPSSWCHGGCDCSAQDMDYSSPWCLTSFGSANSPPSCKAVNASTTFTRFTLSISAS